MTAAAKGSVLVLTYQFDATADSVVARLNDRGVPVFRCDTAEFPQGLTLSARVDGEGRSSLDNGLRRLDLAAVGAVYYRRPREFRLPERMSEDERQFAAAQSRAGFLGVVASLPCLWINHPAHEQRANYKPWQLRVAQDLGLNPPRSIITNDPSAARKFAAEVGAPIITKSLGSPVDTVVVDPDEFDDTVRLCAHLFQEWVDKTHDVRLTVVGPHFFAVEIHAGSDAARVDWRTDYGSLIYRPTVVPEALRRRVKAFMREFQLTFGAFDFAVTPEGTWRFLEVNANGQWHWIEQQTGMPIARSIAGLLEKGTSNDSQ